MSKPLKWQTKCRTFIRFSPSMYWKEGKLSDKGKIPKGEDVQFRLFLHNFLEQSINKVMKKFLCWKQQKTIHYSVGTESFFTLRKHYFIYIYIYSSIFRDTFVLSCNICNTQTEVDFIIVTIRIGWIAESRVQEGP